MADKKIVTFGIDALKHGDKRVNIPTEELRDFVAEDEKAPKPVLYPRDPSLDPQLVWKGKDEQDREELSVPAVPVYIQEKIHPQAIIEDLRVSIGRRADDDAQQLELFADFNGLDGDFERQVEFYQHEQHWANRLILGDSLLVMNSLAEKEGLKGQVQMIYMDPPYGIKFGSNWQVSTRKRDVKDGSAPDMTRQPEQVRAFRDTWKLGIHSYLAYLRDRLVVARELLTESGSIFVQIGEENVHLVRCLLDEVFGSENRAGLISFRKTSGLTAGLLAQNADYLLWYAKDSEHVKFRQIHLEKGVDSDLGFYGYAELPDGSRRRLASGEDPPPGAVLYSVGDLTSSHFYSEGTEPFRHEGKRYAPGSRYWTTSPAGMRRLAWAHRLHVSTNTLRYVRFMGDFPVQPLTANWTDTITGQYSDPRLYVVQTGTKVVQRCIQMTTDPGDLVLDPTCGSGTTAYVAEQWGRRWITTDTSRVALTLARTRLMAARYPYYLLADSPEGALAEARAGGHSARGVEARGARGVGNPSLEEASSGRAGDETGDSRPEDAAGQRGISNPSRGTAPAGGLDIKKGFAYRRVPHVTLKSIANNEEIDAIHERWEPELTPVAEALASELAATEGEACLRRLNGSGAARLEEWEVPREAERSWPQEAKDLLARWWELRRKRQEEIDASIARNADTEVLYDQPYEDPKRIRVTGPFTVESLSPHRVLDVEEKVARSEGGSEALPGVSVKVLGPDTFGQTIIENLKKAGVQNTKKNERLKFESLEPFAGEWLQAAGEYTDRDGRVRRAAVALGPEYGTVGPELVKEAAKEAMRGAGFDLLIVCGFAFDAHAGETAREFGDSGEWLATSGEGTPLLTAGERRFGRLPVLLARMNPDLAMGDELLKKTGAGNLFMVFGEPDVVVERTPEGRVVLEIRGVDVYDPTTGEIRSSSTDDIACWFVDTEYNEESFFVRHAYFTGADEPYEKLKRALRAEIDEAAWASLYSTRSRPFDPPESGKVAVKVINHYGDEVLKVFEVR